MLAIGSSLMSTVFEAAAVCTQAGACNAQDNWFTNSGANAGSRRRRRCQDLQTWKVKTTSVQISTDDDDDDDEYNNEHDQGKTK